MSSSIHELTAQTALVDRLDHIIQWSTDTKPRDFGSRLRSMIEEAQRDGKRQVAPMVRSVETLIDEMVC